MTLTPEKLFTFYQQYRNLFIWKPAEKTLITNNLPTSEARYGIYTHTSWLPRNDIVSPSLRSPLEQQITWECIHNITEQGLADYNQCNKELRDTWQIKRINWKQKHHGALLLPRETHLISDHQGKWLGMTQGIQKELNRAEVIR